MLLLSNWPDPKHSWFLWNHILLSLSIMRVLLSLLHCSALVRLLHLAPALTCAKTASSWAAFPKSCPRNCLRWAEWKDCLRRGSDRRRLWTPVRILPQPSLPGNRPRIKVNGVIAFSAEKKLFTSLFGHLESLAMAWGKDLLWTS